MLCAKMLSEIKILSFINKFSTIVEFMSLYIQYMNHKLNKEQKHYKSQFIHKLVDIMNIYPNLIDWVQQGSCIEIFNFKQFSKLVLPIYFRHSKYQSFIRQLHLYDFKQKKQLKSRVVFQHKIFRKNNQSQFTRIQRIKNKKQKNELLKDFQNNDIAKDATNSKYLTQQQKFILNFMLTYKFFVIQKEKMLKNKLYIIKQSIQKTKNNEIKDIHSIIQDQILVEIDNSDKFSKSIDLFLKNSLEQRAQSRKYTQIQQKISQQSSKVKYLNKTQLQAKQILYLINEQRQQLIQQNQQIQNDDKQNFDNKQSSGNQNKINHSQQPIIIKSQHNKQEQNFYIDFQYKQPSLIFLPMNYYKQSFNSFNIKWNQNSIQQVSDNIQNKQKFKLN